MGKTFAEPLPRHEYGQTPLARLHPVLRFVLGFSLVVIVFASLAPRAHAITCSDGVKLSAAGA